MTWEAYLEQRASEKAYSDAYWAAFYGPPRRRWWRR